MLYVNNISIKLEKCMGGGMQASEREKLIALFIFNRLSKGTVPLFNYFISGILASIRRNKGSFLTYDFS